MTDRETIVRQTAEYFKTQPVLKAWLFGSYSRGEQREDSDVDILIVPDKTQHFSLFTLSEIYEDLKTFSHWDRYLGMMTAMTQVPVPTTAKKDEVCFYVLTNKKFSIW